MTVPSSQDLSHPEGCPSTDRPAGWPGVAGATGATIGAPHRETRGSRYRFAALSVSSISVALAAASIWSPDLIAGTDDTTHVPIATIVSPIAGVLATAFASVFVAGSSGGGVAQS